MVKINPISNTRKNNRLTILTALATKKLLSTATKTVTIAPTIQNG